MKFLRAYILEDEIITQEVLKQTLESLGYIVCGMQTNAKKALEDINTLKPDFVILDIKVDGLETGIWLGNQLKMPIIYLTAFADIINVREAVKTNPISYLQKPFKEKELFIALELVKNKIKNKKELIIKERDLRVKIDVDSILYAKKEDHYLILYLHDSKKIIRATVKEFLNKVNKDFIQVHRSYIINKNYVSGYSKKIIKIKDIKIPISQSYSKEVEQVFL